MTDRMRYDPEPRYAPVDGEVVAGWTALAAASAVSAGGVLALDGPQLLEWPTVRDALVDAFADHGRRAVTIDLREHVRAWDEVEKLTAPADRLAGDPDFATLPTIVLADLLGPLPQPDPAADLTIVFGPGAGLMQHDELWWVDVPKRYAEAAVGAGQGRNLAQPADAGPPTTRRLFYLDWPLLDRHRDELSESLDRWVDAQDVQRPVAVSGECLRATAAWLAERPFRTRPTFNTTTWGGHWAQDELGMNPDARNTALGYELIAPESGVLVGDTSTAAEIPFQLLVHLQPDGVLGPAVHARFGDSFPVRFDYLDTVGGGSLSVHCHPQSDYMRDVFGWPYTQHETYYVMVGSEQNTVYLGLRGDRPVAEFHDRAHAAAEHGEAFDITDYVNTFPAQQHQLFLIPAGTPHGSGKGNVVLEVSATPYLYSLRFYDWLRRDTDGSQRPVHVEHAFDNLDTDRTGEAVRRDLVQTPRVRREGEGWRDELIGSLPDMFFDVERVVVQPDAAATRDTGDRFHVLTVVQGQGAWIRWDGGTHALAYAETMVVPAAVGQYRVEAVGTEQVMVVGARVT